MTLVVRPTANLDDIKAVLSHPAIWDAITYDGDVAPEAFEWGIFSGWTWIGGYLDGVPFAMMGFHPHGAGDKLHVQVLPSYRNDYAREFSGKALTFGQFPLSAEIPDIYPNVQAFAELFGFLKTETVETDKRKNGTPVTISRYVRYQ